MRIFLAIFIPILQILYISAESNGKRDLTFSLAIANETQTNQYIMSKDPIEVDAFANNQILITIQKISPFKFFCQTSKLKLTYPIVKASLCLKEDLTVPERCVEVQNAGNVDFQSSQFSVAFNPLKGFEADLQLEKSENLHGYLFCKLENANDRIISNNIEFQNINYYKTILSSVYEPALEVKRQNIRLRNTFDCGTKISNKDQNIPFWMKPSLGNTFLWFFCTDSNSKPESCFNPIYYRLKENEQYRVFSNYSIELFDSAFDKNNTIRIQCRSRANIFYSGVTVEKFSTKEKKSPYIQVFSKKSNIVDIREGNTLNDYKLSAAYISTEASFVWQKDNGPLPTDLQNDGHSLTFPKTITTAHQGKYVLEVRQKYPEDTVHFEFRVNVLTLPKIMNGYEVPKIVYVMSGKSLNLTTRLRGNDIKTSVEINGFPIATSDPIQQKIDFRNFRNKYPYLSKMSIQLSEKDNKSYKELVYRIEKISGLWFKTGYSHRVTFLASNQIGSARISTLIKAIEKPRWKINLNQFPCVEKCFSNEPHFFKCAIFREEYEDVGLQVKYQWKINGVELQTLFSEKMRNIYFTIGNEELVINKISTDNNVRDLRVIEKLQNATLSCSVSILIPTVIGNGKISLRELYNSGSDPLSLSVSQTTISIITNNILQDGSNTIIWIICIPLIVITVLTTITVCTCYFIRSGKTYDIDQNERFAGKDPEKETFDSLYFKHYNREEESDTPVVNDHISWSEHSCRNDVGELDLYDTENENFDEGSIIGQYADESKR